LLVAYYTILAVWLRPVLAHNLREPLSWPNVGRPSWKRRNGARLHFVTSMQVEGRYEADRPDQGQVLECWVVEAVEQDLEGVSIQCLHMFNAESILYIKCRALGTGQWALTTSVIHYAFHKGSIFAITIYLSS
jgi:hypothetical protein